MAKDPNNDAEQLLKRYAEERRSADAPELHPANRRMLQGEVTRVYGTGAHAVVPWWRKWLVSPQVGWALGVTLVLGISVLALRQPAPRPAEVPKSDAKDAIAPKAPPVVAPQPKVKKSDTPAEVEHENVPSILVETAPASAVAPVPAARDEMKVLKREQQSQMPVRAMPATATASTPSAAPANEFMFSNTLATENLAKNNDGGFSNFGAANNLANNNSDVLNRFSMRQAGRRLDFRDADGSSYTGQVVALRQGTNVFRAVGTNVTLQQAVVFTGQISSAAAPALPQQQTRSAPQQVPLAQRSLRVQGQATIGRTNQIQIDAQTLAPAR